ncbi:MAG: hypothetical protein Q8L14_06085 [Myxococcales bacterium]|nr:hypothetical protein [Myxococcales bacterium]
MPTVRLFWLLLVSGVSAVLTACSPHPSCVPTSCEAQSRSCGQLDDGCGGRLECGVCAVGGGSSNTAGGTGGGATSGGGGGGGGGGAGGGTATGGGTSSGGGTATAGGAAGGTTLPITPRGCFLVEATDFRRSPSITNRIDARLPGTASLTLTVFSALPRGVVPLLTGPIAHRDGGVQLEVVGRIPPLGSDFAVTAGVIESFAAQSAATSELSAGLRDVVLRQTDFIDGGWVVSTDGGCLELEDVTFDTRPSTGSCEFASQCGAAGTAGCDPATRRCVSSCPANAEDGGSLCRDQIGGGRAWFETCDFSTPCRGGFTCVPYSKTGGFCHRAGTLPLGDPTCSQTDVTDTCAAGSYCLSLPPMGITFPKACAKVCDEYAPMCPGVEKCVLHTCMAQPWSDPASLGAMCANSHLGWVCGETTTTFLGRCSSFGVDGGARESRCLPRCRSDQDCSGGTHCRDDVPGGTRTTVCF